ncbi:unnamed protein product [Cuscuta europaea]|uniref:Uncharacterized protein n=1 Tax=Cuscuta europaea TaxID=41803 RepID=A0A9P1EN27_CUSEU|nr:unnamed protein product [Cuscuta europaea]
MGGACKRKRNVKKPTQASAPEYSQSAVQQPKPIQQIPLEQVNFEDMAVDQPFEAMQIAPIFTEHLGSGSTVPAEADQAHLSKRLERITLEDPIHEVLEHGGAQPANSGMPLPCLMTSTSCSYRLNRLRRVFPWPPSRSVCTTCNYRLLV